MKSIICGAGSVGTSIAQKLSEEGLDVAGRIGGATANGK